MHSLLSGAPAPWAAAQRAPAAVAVCLPELRPLKMESGVAQVLTLMAGIGAALDEPILAAARATLREAGAEPGPLSWLAPDRACDIPFSGADPLAVEAALRRHL